MELYDKNKLYTFIPTNFTIDDIKKMSLIQSNDIYEKHNATATISGELISCNNYDNTIKETYTNYEETYTNYEEIYTNYEETYTDYEKTLKLRDLSKDKWIYNIIDGYDEQDKIIFQDELFILIPTYTWNLIDLKKFHLLAIIKDKNLRSIRDLRNEHINLLNYIKKKSLSIIETKYNMNSNKIKMYFHYLPSTYQLHIHFADINNKNVNSSVEYSHELNMVVYNLSLYSEYYKKINLFIYKTH